jgi:hypothetical protein
MKLYRLIEVASGFSAERKLGEGLRRILSIPAQKEKSSEISSPVENVLACHSSPRARETRKPVGRPSGREHRHHLLAGFREEVGHLWTPASSPGDQVMYKGGPSLRENAIPFAPAIPLS